MPGLKALRPTPWGKTILDRLTHGQAGLKEGPAPEGGRSVSQLVVGGSAGQMVVGGSAGQLLVQSVSWWLVGQLVSWWLVVQSVSWWLVGQLVSWCWWFSQSVGGWYVSWSVGGWWLLGGLLGGLPHGTHGQAGIQEGPARWLVGQFVAEPILAELP